MAIPEQIARIVHDNLLGLPPDLQAKGMQVLTDYKAQQEAFREPLWPSQERAQDKAATAFRKLFQDRERHGLDANTFDEFQRSLANTTDPEGGRYRTINRQFFADLTGEAPDKLAGRYDALRDAYAKQKWGMEKPSDKAFFDKLADDFDQSDEIAAAALTAATRDAASGKRDWVAAWTGSGIDEAKFPDKFQAWEWRDQFRQIYEGQEMAIAPVAGEAKAFADALQRSMTGEGQDGDETLLNQFRDRMIDAPHDERQAMLRALTVYGADLGEAQGGKNWFKQAGESAARLVAGMATGDAQATEIQLSRFNTTGTVRFFKPIDSPEAADELVALYGAERPETGQGFNSDPLHPLFGKGEARKLTAEERKLVEAAKAKAMRSISVARDITRIAESADPIKSVAAAVVGSSGALMLTASTPVGAFIAAAGYQNLEFDRLRQEQPDMSLDDAQAIAVVSGAAQAALDRLGTSNLVFRGLPKTVAMLKGGATRQALGRLAGNAAVGFAAENLIEGAQDLATPTAQSIFAALKEDVPRVDWDAEWSRWSETRGDVAIGMLPLTLLGMGIAGVRDVRNARGMMASYDTLTASGLDESAARSIVDLAASGKVEQARGQLVEAWETRQKASAEAFAKIEADQQARMDALTRLETAGILPGMRRTESGWMLTFQDGQGAEFASHAEADAARWEYAANNALAVAEETRLTIRQLEQSLEPGRELTYEFSPERMDTQRAKAEGLADPEAIDERLQIGEMLANVGAEFEQAQAATRAASVDGEAAEITGQILGMNQSQWVDGIQKTTIRLFQGASPLTVVEEKLEADVAQMLRQGRAKWLVSALREYEAVSGDKLLAPDVEADLFGQDEKRARSAVKAVREAYSHLGTSYFVGRSRRGDAGPMSSRFRSLAAALMRTRLGGVLTAYGRFFQAVFKRAAKLRKLTRDGKLNPELERELARSLGISEQQQESEAQLIEAERLALEMADSIGDTGFVATDGAPFSVIPEMAAQDPAYLAAVEAGDLATAQRMVDEASLRAEENLEALRFARKSESSVTFEFVEDEDWAGGGYWDPVYNGDVDVELPSVFLEEDGTYSVSDDGAAYSSLEEAQAASVQRILAEADERGSVFGADLDAQSAAQDLIKELNNLFPGDGWESSKWGSFYLTYRDRDDQRVKLSIRDHPVSRTDMGHVSKAFYVSKDWRPDEVGNALKSALVWINEEAPARAADAAKGADLIGRASASGLESRQSLARPGYSQAPADPSSPSFSAIPRELARSLGISEQQQEAEAQLIEAERLAVEMGDSLEYVPPTDEDAPFSVLPGSGTQLEIVGRQIETFAGYDASLSRYFLESERWEEAAREFTKEYQRNVPPDPRSLPSSNSGPKSERKSRSEAKRQAAITKAEWERDNPFEATRDAKIGPRPVPPTFPVGEVVDPFRNENGTVKAGKAQNFLIGELERNRLKAEADRSTLSDSAYIYAGDKIRERIKIRVSNHSHEIYDNADVRIGKREEGYWPTSYGLYKALNLLGVANANEKAAMAISGALQQPSGNQEGAFPSGVSPSVAMTADEPSQVSADPSSPSFSAIPRERFPRDPADFEARMVSMFDPFQRSPKLRIELAREMQRRVIREGRKWHTAAAALRSGADIERERKERYDAAINERVNSLDDSVFRALAIDKSLADPKEYLVFEKLLRQKTYQRKDGKVIAYWAGRLESPSAYKKRTGKPTPAEYNGMGDLPSWVFGGTLRPDEARDELGLQTTNDLWYEIHRAIDSAKLRSEEIASATATVRAMEKEAKAEADAWAEAEKAASDAVDNRDILLGSLRTLNAMISSLPPEVRGKVGGFVAIAQLQSPAAMLRELDYRAKVIERELEQWLRKDLRKQLEKQFKKAKLKKTPGKKAGGSKLGADGHKWLAFAESASTMSPTERDGKLAGLEAAIVADITPDRLAELKEWLGRKVGEDEARDILEEQARIVELVGSALYGRPSEGADAARLAGAVDLVESMRMGFRNAYLEELAKERERREVSRKQLIADTGKAGTAAERDRKAIKEYGNVLGMLGRFAKNLLPFEGVARYVFGDNSAEAQALADMQRVADNQKDDAIFAAMDRIEALFTRLGGTGKRLDGQRVQWRLSRKDTTVGGRLLSQLEMLTAVLMWRQEDGKRHMVGNLDEAGQPVGEWHYDQAFMDELESKLTREAREVLDFISEEYAAEYARLNPVYREMNGVDLPRNENYAPLSVAPVLAPGGQMGDPVTGATVSGRPGSPGSLKTRGGSVAEPNFVDAVQKLISHKKEIEHWIAYARFNKEARAIIAHRSVTNAVKSKAGDEGAKILLSWTDNLAGMGARDASAHLAVMQAVGGITNRAAAMGVVGRIGTLALQSTQLLAATAEIPTAAYVPRMAKLLTGQLGWRDAIRSDYIQRRIKQMPPVVQQGMAALEATEPSAIKDAAKRLGQLISGVDGIFTAGTYAIVLDYRRAEGIKAGLPAAEAERRAHIEAERITDRVAQPTRTGARSIVEVTSTNPFMRLGWAFASEARKNLGLIIGALLRRNVRDARKAIIFTIVLNGALSEIIRAGWRDLRDSEEGDDDWDLERMALGAATSWLNGIPGLGDAIEGAVFAAAGEYLPEGNMLSSLAGGVKALGNLDEMFTGEADLDTWMRTLEAIGQGMGLFNDNLAGFASIMHLVRDLAGVAENVATDD